MVAQWSRATLLLAGKLCRGAPRSLRPRRSFLQSPKVLAVPRCPTDFFNQEKRTFLLGRPSICEQNKVGQ